LDQTQQLWVQTPDPRQFKHCLYAKLRLLWLVHTADADETKLGRDETKLSCRRCEQAIRLRSHCHCD